MADELNGREPSLGALRVAFASGTQPGAQPAVVDASVPGHVTVNGREEPATLALGEPPRARLETEAGRHKLLLIPLPHPLRAADGIARIEVVIDGWRFELDVESEARARLRERATSTRAGAARGGASELRAIIPGRVVSVEVAVGDTVELGGRLLVLEAMKMQNEVRAPRGGTVTRVAVGPGETVELGDVLLVIE
jgi:biotin carboxyl carrier protein